MEITQGTTLSTPCLAGGPHTISRSNYRTKNHIKMGVQLLDYVEIKLKLPWPCFTLQNRCTSNGRITPELSFPDNSWNIFEGLPNRHHLCFTEISNSHMLRDYKDFPFVIAKNPTNTCQSRLPSRCSIKIKF